MLNAIWIVLITASLIYSFFSGTANEVGDAVFTGAVDCVQFTLKIGAFMAMWSGFINIAEESGLSHKTAGALSPFISKVFKGVKKNSREAMLIATNMTANMLGLSNAATPLGIEAMKELAKKSDGKTATDDMCLLAIINSASLQLVPTTLIAMRTASGSRSASDIIVPVWIVSALTLMFAIIMAKFFSKKG